MLEFFYFEKKNSKFCLPGLRIFFWATKGGKDKIFFWKKTHMFLGTRLRKKGWVIHFWRNFRFWEKIWATKGGNDGRREWRNEGMTGMILPRPYSKTWFIYDDCLLQLDPIGMRKNRHHKSRESSSDWKRMELKLKFVVTTPHDSTGAEWSANRPNPDFAAK